MIFGQSTEPPAQPVDDTWWTRTKRVAGKVEEVIDGPIDDIAAVIGVETAWLAGVLLGLKFIATGFACSCSVKGQKPIQRAP